MKFKTLLGLSAAFLVVSCAINKKAYNNASQVAVISINSIEKVKNNSSIQARFLTEMRDLDTVLMQPASMVQEQFYGLQLPKLLKKLVPEEDILSNPQFKDYATQNDNVLKGLDQAMNLGVKYVAAEGYPVIQTSQKELIMEAFDALPSNIDAVIVLSNRFSFEETTNYGVGGLSSAGAHAQRVRSELLVYILNKDGKKILHKVFMGTSEDKLMDKSKGGKSLQEIADQALSESMMEFQEFLVKKVGG